MIEADKTFILDGTGLKKQYPNTAQPALKGIDIRIRKGEAFGLLGPNGAGKTTAISILSTLMLPTSGTIFIDGVDATRHPRNVRPWIGIVPQDIALYLELTIRENLAYFGRLYGIRGRHLKERIQDCLLFVGLEDRAHQRISTCSGGIKRRANLAVGILHQPKLLFLDEPTVGIDAHSRNMILEKLAMLKQSGISMLYTTHYMEEAQTLCNRVAILDEGKIIVSGTVDQLTGQHPGVNNLGELFLLLTGQQLRDS